MDHKREETDVHYCLKTGCCEITLAKNTNTYLFTATSLRDLIIPILTFKAIK